jgi:hypothetical protein
MNQQAPPPVTERWSRPQLERVKPNRTAGGLYRTADGGRPGVGGVPLGATEDTVVAAVRMAYRVAEAQIDRSARLAQRLRESGDRAVGARSDRKAIDATEQLIVRAMMSGLAWVEGLAGDRDVLRRLLVAQNKIQSGVVESILGFPPGASSSPSGAASDAAPRAADTPIISDPLVPNVSTGHEPGRLNSRSLKVVLKGLKRPVRVCRYELAVAAPDQNPHLQFFSDADIKSAPLDAKLDIEADGTATLEVTILRDARPGLWKAAICDAHDVQIGMVEFIL